MAPTLGANSSRHSLRLYNKAINQIRPSPPPPVTKSPIFTAHTICLLKFLNQPKKIEKPKLDSAGMVVRVPLGPGKFYGSSLPRPRIFADTKLNPERVDPPVSVMDPFLSWANEAHWSMGGLSFSRLRLQGRIEGSITELRKEREKFRKTQIKHSPRKGSSVSPPPAPVAVKRRRLLALSDEEEEEEVVVKKSYKRKLVNDFDRVVDDDDGLIGVTMRSKLLKGDDEVKEVSVSAEKTTKKAKNMMTDIRTSPRLAKRGLKMK